MGGSGSFPAAAPLRLPWLAACLAVLMLGGSDPGSVAADREGDPGVAVCVVAPRVEPMDDLDAYGLVLTPEPVLVLAEPLLELQIQRLNRDPWMLRGSADRPIATPMLWPTDPINPDEPVLLQMRPVGASPEAFAHVQLMGASRQRMEQTLQLLEALGEDPLTWLAAFEQALEQQDVPLAWTLLFDRRSPSSPELNQLRRTVVERGCGE
ncbi:MAG: hypothetical protein WBN89_13405 [Prochlorococcaceae cyanobacterium]